MPHSFTNNGLQSTAIASDGSVWRWCHYSHEVWNDGAAMGVWHARTACDFYAVIMQYGR